MYEKKADDQFCAKPPQMKNSIAEDMILVARKK